MYVSPKERAAAALSRKGATRPDRAVTYAPSLFNAGGLSQLLAEGIAKRTEDGRIYLDTMAYWKDQGREWLAFSRLFAVALLVFAGLAYVYLKATA